MNRRDTIIIAVMGNAALLAFLFMMAINSDDDKVSEPVDLSQSLIVQRESQNREAQAQERETVSTGSVDEVDNALKHYVEAPPLLNGKGNEEEFLQYAEGPQVIETTLAEQESSGETKDAGIKYVEVTVKRGDFLEKIARANGTSVVAIKEANQLKTERLTIGQVLRIPVGNLKKSTDKELVAMATKSTESGNKNPSQKEPQYYTIKSGDNPWKIAKQFQVKVDDLLKLNGLDEEKARNLKIGDRIRVR